MVFYHSPRPFIVHSTAHLSSDKNAKTRQERVLKRLIFKVYA